MSQLSFDPIAADLAAVDGMDRATHAERVQLWKAAARAWFMQLPHGAEVTADDLIREVGLPDIGPAKNNVVGAIFSAASKRRYIVFTGRMQKSERVIRHGNLQRVWRKV